MAFNCSFQSQKPLFSWIFVKRFRTSGIGSRWKRLVKANKSEITILEILILEKFKLYASILLKLDISNKFTNNDIKAPLSSSQNSGVTNKLNLYRHIMLELEKLNWSS